MCAHGSCHHQQGPCSRQSFWSDACFGILKGVPSQLSSIDPKFKTPPMGIKVADSLLPSHMDSAVTNDGLSVPNVHHSMQLMCAGRKAVFVSHPCRFRDIESSALFSECALCPAAWSKRRFWLLSAFIKSPRLCSEQSF